MVLVDFTRASVNGVEGAKRVLKNKTDQLHLVNFVPPPDSDSVTPEQLHQVMNRIIENENHFVELVEKCELQNDKRVCTKILQESNIKQGIDDYVAKHNITKVIVGSNKAHTIADLFNEQKSNGSTIKTAVPVEIVNPAKLSEQSEN